MNKLLKICIVGPESTGKSKLAELLAKHFNTIWVPEYAREYLENFTGTYTVKDILNIGIRQIRLENEMAESAEKVLISDTSAIVEKVWMEHSFGYCEPELHRISFNSISAYDLVLLTDIDLPWQPDPLREHPYKRNYFIEEYKRQLQNSSVNYLTVNGLGEARFQCALQQIKQRLSI